MRVCGVPVIMIVASSTERQMASPWCASRRKRMFDIIVAALALLLTAPVSILIVLAIRGTSPGPVIFRQIRLGLNARPFELLKFRTMYDAAGTESGPGVTRRGDCRVTWLGKWLRRCKLDE